MIEFIDTHRDRFGVEPMCRVLTEHGVRVAPSTYDAAKHRLPSKRAQRDEEVLVEIRRVYHARRRGRGLYGVRKVWHQLCREHERGEHQLGPMPRCQVERLMRADGLCGARRGGKRFVTTKADPDAPRPADLVQRQFAAAAPNRLWVVDFTYVPTWEQMGDTAFVHDVCSHRIIGWRTAGSMPTELPPDALEMAIWIRQRNGEPIDGVTHHSDAGSQYTAISYMLRLDDVDALASIGSIGDSYDNAMAESLIGLYKTECLALDGPFRTVAELELATCDWVHWFNHDRLHSSISYSTPIEFEHEHYRQINTRQQPLSA